MLLSLFCLTLTTSILGFPSASIRALRSSNSRHPSISRALLNERYTKDIETLTASQNLNVYLRFSPLVGGPSFLPIHVEVILHHISPPNLQTTVRRKIGDTLSNDMDGETKIISRDYLHRLDFLPENPSDPSTLFNLLTLRSVPALIRHRILVARLPTTSQIVMESTKKISIQEVSKSKFDSLIGKQEGLTGSSRKVVIPLGSVQLSNNNADTQDIPELPISMEMYLQKQLGMELSLLTNNCYSFAW
eukprot:CAMPEP_0198268684 /NCGR_PEP_ID=MMETSP1447-20131203/38354_1 /TAXON_ID=420782 /ORGANISM="Chaetoceros dichaeta, Strain CCMP1751" /LENGTH=246 /DNA_ID=CAMNT_0043959873 /DNA_START=62 /DNA_END=799 /DNA_ORIENTATION=+